jgi:hypothetical protein
VVEIVIATMAISGVAVFKPMIMARWGMANIASANPNVDRSNVANETMDNTRIVDSSKFIVILRGKNSQPFTVYKEISTIQQAVI